MADEIHVSVHRWGEGRNLMLRWTDPISGQRKAKSAGTTNWRKAERLAGVLEKKLRTGEFQIDLAGTQMIGSEAGRIVSDIGEKAGVVVDPETGKTGSGHDMRRAFGTRWAQKVMPMVLKRLMRHRQISTTEQYVRRHRRRRSGRRVLAGPQRQHRGKWQHQPKTAAKIEVG